MAAILSNFSSILLRVADAARLRHVHAIAASQRGDKLLKKFGFECVRPAKLRMDGHDFYSIQFDALAKKIGEMSRDGARELSKLESLAEQKLGPESARSATV